MSGIDILMLIVFVGAVIFGYRKGVIVQMGAVGGVIVGILACRLFGAWFAGILGGVTSSDAGSIDVGYVNGVIANVILFILGYVAARLVARLVKTVTHAVKLAIIDRLCGVVFCLFEWFLILSILLNIWLIIRPDADVTAMSRLGGGRAVKVVIDLAPTVFGSETAKCIFDGADS